jgi:hypothetical protein
VEQFAGGFIVLIFGVAIWGMLGLLTRCCCSIDEMCECA